MNVRYRVTLSQSERDDLPRLVSGGKAPVRRLKRRQILLAADGGISDEAIAASVQTSGSTIYRTKKRFVEISLEAALSEEPRPGAARKLSGKDEVQLVALACSVSMRCGPQVCLDLVGRRSATRKGRLFDLGGFADVAVDLVADDAISHLVQILGESSVQLLELGPKDLVDERAGNFEHYGRDPLSVEPVRLQSVAAA
jgi:hypothetical protein